MKLHIELCTNLPLNWGHLSIQDSQQVPMVSSIERFHSVYEQTNASRSSYYTVV